MNSPSRFIWPLFGGCALGLACLALSGCSEGSSQPNLLPMPESTASADGKPAAASSVGSQRHGRAVKAPRQNIKTSEDADLSAKELRAKKLKAKGAAGGAQP